MLIFFPWLNVMFCCHGCDLFWVLCTDQSEWCWDRGAFLSVLQETVDRTQPYQEEQGGDTTKPLTGNYRDGSTRTHSHTLTHLHTLSLSTLKPSWTAADFNQPSNKTETTLYVLSSNSSDFLLRETLPEIKLNQQACVMLAWTHTHTHTVTSISLSLP